MTLHRIGGSEVTQRIADLVRDTPGTRQTREQLSELLASLELRSGYSPQTGGELPADTLKQAAASAKDEVRVAERRLEQSIRTLRREQEGRASPAAIRVLTHDVLRLTVESMAWRKLGELIDQEGTRGPSLVAVRQAGTAAEAQALLKALSQPEGVERSIALLAQVAGKRTSAAKGPRARAKGLDAEQAVALAEALRAKDPQYGALIKERVAAGQSVEALRGMLFARIPPVSLESSPLLLDQRDKKVGGLVFDLGTNTWAAKDRSWGYEVSLGQLFDYQVDGIIEGTQELKARLQAAATDPATGQLDPAEAADIEAFVDDLGRAKGSRELDFLVGQKLEMVFATTDGGSTPVEAIWELPRTTVADFFVAKSDPAVRARIRELAGEQANSEASWRDRVQGRLHDLLLQYPGVPQRHKRAHAALINLGLAGQTIEGMKRKDGVLPLERTFLTPEALATRYADVEHVKLRFLFTHDFELMVLGDDLFKEVVDKYHFPPNHELLSYNKRIAGSGYISISRGQIVGLEDDVVMLPGKLPDKLPPAIEVLRALGYALDEEQIKASMRVIAWKTMTKLLPKSSASGAPEGGPEEVREKLIGACFEQTGPLPLLVAYVHKLLDEQKGVDRPAALARVTETVEKALAGFRLIDVEASHFQGGDLPAELDEWGELEVNAQLAGCLVRKIDSSRKAAS